MSGRKKHPPEEQPTEGGSYLRDPATGALTRVEHPALDPTDPLHAAAANTGATPDAPAPDQPPAGDTPQQEG